MTTYEVYDVEFCDEEGGKMLHFYSSITGEIANKEGQFPGITEEQAWHNYLAHVSSPSRLTLFSCSCSC